MKVLMKGKKTPITLNQSDFVARGGEGDVYQKNGLCYKVCDPSKMIPDGKFVSLSSLNDPHIVRPIEPFTTDDGHVGYTMDYVSDAFSLCQLMTVTFRNKNKVTNDHIMKLVRQMRDGFQFIHNNKCLIVDASEMNFLVSPAFDFLYFIDVNSYETPGYRATMITDSIRDRQVSRGADGHFHWTTLSDWFSFGILSFQLFIGMHAFKGKHPRHFNTKNSMDGCMRENLSILNPDVKYPKAACMPFSVIPDVYMRWYQAVFEKGQRIPPPTDFVDVIHIVTAPFVPVFQQISGSKFKINEFSSFRGKVVRHLYCEGQQIVTNSEQQVFVNGKLALSSPQTVNVGVTNKGVPVAGYLEGNEVRLYNLSGTSTPIKITMNGQAMMSTEGRIYVKNQTQFYEIAFAEVSGQLFPATKIVANVMEHSTQVFEGVVVQSFFGSKQVMIFPAEGQCHQFVMKELEGYKVVEARYEKRVLMMVVLDSNTGLYDRLIFRFSRKFDGYDIRTVSDVSNMGVNFTVLDNNRVACITEDEKFEVFLAEKDHKAVNVFDDPAIEADMILTSRINDALFMRGDKLYSITARTQ